MRKNPSVSGSPLDLGLPGEEPPQSEVDSPADRSVIVIICIRVIVRSSSVGVLVELFIKNVVDAPLDHPLRLRSREHIGKLVFNDPQDS